MTAFLSVRDDVNRWFTQYFNDFIAIGAGKIGPSKILVYWSVPLHMSGSTFSKWFNSPEEVIGFLKEMQGALKQGGYTHTEMLDRNTIVYNENAGRVETIMSRRRADGSEMDRTAISFEIRSKAESWTIISAGTRPTEAIKLNEVR